MKDHIKYKLTKERQKQKQTCIMITTPQQAINKKLQCISCVCITHISKSFIETKVQHNMKSI